MEAILGVELFNEVIQATELPETAVEKELQKLLSEAGFEKDNFTLDDLREVMAQYLQTVFLELAENESPLNRVS